MKTQSLKIIIHSSPPLHFEKFVNKSGDDFILNLRRPLVPKLELLLSQKHQ